MLRVSRVHRTHFCAFHDKRGTANREKPGLSTGLTDSLGPAGGVVQEARAITVVGRPPRPHPSDGATTLAEKGDSLGVEQAWGLAVAHIAGQLEAGDGLGPAGAFVEVYHGHEVGDAGAMGGCGFLGAPAPGADVTSVSVAILGGGAMKELELEFRGRQSS